MVSRGKAEVRIFGQTYTVAGDVSTDNIIKIAKFVNDKMEKIATAFGNSSTTAVAVLAAINIAEDLYRTIDEANMIQEQISQIQKGAEMAAKSGEQFNDRYEQLWEETKSNFAQRRYELQVTKDNLEKISIQLQEKTEECAKYAEELETKTKALTQLRTDHDALAKEHEKLKKENEKLKNTIGLAESVRKESEAKKKALDAKEKEFENEFIEMQMENVKLKNELEKYRKDMDER